MTISDGYCDLWFFKYSHRSHMVVADGTQDSCSFNKQHASKIIDSRMMSSALKHSPVTIVGDELVLLFMFDFQWSQTLLQADVPIALWFTPLWVHGSARSSRSSWIERLSPQFTLHACVCMRSVFFFKILRICFFSLRYSFVFSQSHMRDESTSGWERALISMNRFLFPSDSFSCRWIHLPSNRLCQLHLDG